MSSLDRSQQIPYRVYESRLPLKTKPDNLTTDTEYQSYHAILGGTATAITTVAKVLSVTAPDGGVGLWQARLSIEDDTKAQFDLMVSLGPEGMIVSYDTIITVPRLGDLSTGFLVDKWDDSLPSLTVEQLMGASA